MVREAEKTKMIEKERRKDRRVPVEFPVVYEIQEICVPGKAVNGWNEGLMVECHLPLETPVRYSGF
jgi:hypothetical protein